MSRRIALADQLYGGNVESTVLAPLCPNMVIWLKIPKLTWFKLCPSPKKMRHINIDLSMKSNHFSQEMVHEGPISDTRSPTITIYCKMIELHQRKDLERVSFNMKQYWHCTIKLEGLY